jgi:hypothetical protein
VKPAWREDDRDQGRSHPGEHEPIVERALFEAVQARLDVGYLGQSTPIAEGQRMAAFVQRLRELGWIEGQNVAIEVRWAEGRTERGGNSMLGLWCLA